MRNLKKLFDYQTIEKNKSLEAVTNDTHSRYAPNISALDDDSLELVAAGVGISSYDSLQDRNNSKQGN